MISSGMKRVGGPASSTRTSTAHRRLGSRLPQRIGKVALNAEEEVEASQADRGFGYAS